MDWCADGTLGVWGKERADPVGRQEPSIRIRALPTFRTSSTRNRRGDSPAVEMAIPLPLRDALVEHVERFPNVCVVRDYPVLRQIGEIRHRQYVERQGKAYNSIVLDGQCLIEPSDFSSVNIYTSDNHGITCALRIDEVLGDANRYSALFEPIVRRFSLSAETTITCTRLVRAPRHSGRHAVHLIRFVRWQAVHAGWRYCIMQTAEKLVPFFRKFEFHETGIWADDPAAGRLQILVLDTKMRPVQEHENNA